MIPENQCGLSHSSQEKMIQAFSKHSEIEQVILYGSRAKGNFKIGSDIDLSVHSSTMSLPQLFQIEEEIDELYLPYKVDISLFRLIDNPQLKEHIQRVGVSFYKK
jgi:predicted nucleotidyltransferase